jgi:hypothetical protein
MGLSLAKRRSSSKVNAEVNAILAGLEEPEAFGAYLSDSDEMVGLEDYGDDDDVGVSGAKLRLCGGVAFRGFHEE